MRSFGYFLAGIITLLLILFDSMSAAVPPAPGVYDLFGGSGIDTAGMGAPQLTESPSIRPEGSAIGDQEIIVILVEFQDVRHDPASDSAYFHNLIFSKSNPNSMYNYYSEVSYGQTIISGGIAGWYVSSHEMAYYGADGDKIDRLNGSVYELAREAIQLADVDGLDFSQYDTDGNGYVDHIIVIHAGPGQETGGRSYGPNAIWSHHWSIWPSEQVDGVYASDYCMVAEFSPMGTFAHEFGHDLGLPDLYDSDNSSSGIGAWGLMGFGTWQYDGNVPAHPCAWSKVFLGWIEPEEIMTDESGIMLNCVESDCLDSIIKIPLTSNEYFLLENRSRMGFDKYLPGEGLLIWHIDDSAGNIALNNVNEDENHKRVDLEEADGRDDLDRKANYGDNTDPYYLDNAVEFSDYTDPGSQMYSGENSNVSIIDIGQPGTIMGLSISVDESTEPLQQVTVNLAEGWNLISLCLQPVDTQTVQVMSSVEGKYDSVWTYEADTAAWLRYVSSAPSFLNNLHEMKACVGYWIMMNQPGTLLVQGTPVTGSIPLKAGWNMVGFNSQTSISIDEYLITIGDICNSIWTYDSEAAKWLRYDTSAPDFLNSLKYLEPGYGYWIDVSADCMWSMSR